MSDVALRKESVDRNNSWAVWVKPNFRVALRKESVDRNQDRQDAPHLTPGVALRKESVDRNLIDEIQLEFNSRRSPQGERG